MTTGTTIRSQVAQNADAAFHALHERGRNIATVQEKQRGGRSDVVDVFATKSGLVMLWRVYEKHEVVTFEVFTKQLGADNRMDTLMEEIGKL
jgi:hypothetical protein